MSSSLPDVAQLEQQLRAACSEMGKRLRAGESCTAEEYLARNPEIASCSDLALELIYTEFVVRQDLSEPVSSDDWLQRFPQWRDDLQQLFEVHQQVCDEEARRSTQQPDGTGTEPSSRARTKSSALEVGRIVGNYELVEELGRGGMGIVFRARQRNLNRDVALKMILSGEFASPRELHRFQSEAEAAARLQHPNIVQVYEVGTHDGHAFLSMELVDGGSLEDQLKRKPSSPRQSAELLETIARAVHFAHEQAVVHCDLKPSNVMLTRQGSPKVADFGLAKQLVAGKLQHTNSGGVIGTPCYMAPEQASGKSAKIGPATDIYTLGTMLYEMLTGNPPFLSSTPLETLRLVVHDDATPPSRLRSAVPRDLETICLKCLEKDPARRYASAGALADDLHRFLTNEPIHARSVSSAERLVKWVRRRPALALFITSLAVSLVAVFTLWRISEVRRQDANIAAIKAELSRQVAVAHQHRATEESKRATTSLYFHRVAQAQSEWQQFQVHRAGLLLDECPAEFRDWEWRYLKSLCSSEIRTFRGHSDSVRCLAFSRDGKTIASGTGEWGMPRPGEIILWDAATGKRRATLRGHLGPIMGVAFSADSKKVVSCSVGFGAGPGGIKVWSVTGEELLSLESPANSGHYATFSPDGTKLAICCLNGAFRIYDSTKDQELMMLPGHRSAIHQASFRPDGKEIATVSYDGSLRIWSLTNSTTEHVLTGYGDLRQVSYSPDGRFLAFSEYGNDLFIWDLAKPAEEIKRHTLSTDINSFVYSPEGRRIALSGRDGSVRILDAVSAREIKQLRTHDGLVFDIAFDPEGRMLATSGIDHTVKLWNCETDWNEERIPVGEKLSMGYFSGIAVSADGKRLLLPSGLNRGSFGKGERLLVVWDLDKSAVIQTLRGHTEWLTRSAISPDGAWYASSSLDKTARIWNATTGTEHRVLEGHTDAVKWVAFDSTGERIVTASADGTARIWDRATGESLHTFKGPGGEIQAAIFLPDGKSIATAGDNHAILYWDIESGAITKTLSGHTAPVTALSLSTNRKMLASTSTDETVRIWNLETGTAIHVLRGHRGAVSDVSFSHDDQRLASCGVDMSVRLWDIDTGSDALTLRAPSFVSSVAFHPDGKRLISVFDKTLQIWNTEPPSSSRLKDAFDAANLAWHAKETVKCRNADLHTAALFHLDRLIALRSDRPGDFWHRGSVHAELGHWDLAAADFSQVVNRRTSEPVAVSSLVMVHLQTEHVNEARVAYEQMRELVDTYSSVPDIVDVASLALIVPKLVDDFRPIMELAKQVTSADPNKDGHYNLVAATLFRQGHIAEARESFHKSIQVGWFIEDWFFLALLEAHDGNYEAARMWLDKAVRQVATVQLDPEVKPTMTWRHIVRWTLLTREAEAAVEAIRPASS